jgi:hypothetical protein
LGVNVSSVAHEEAHQGCVTRVDDGLMQGSGTILEQKNVRNQMEGGAYIVEEVDVSPSSQEESGHLKVTFRAGQVERGNAVLQVGGGGGGGQKKKNW